MSSHSELIVKIGADAKDYQSKLKKIGDQTKELEQTLAKTAKVSGIAFAAGTAAIVTATVASAKFEEKFTNVVTLLDDASFSTKNLKEGIAGLKQGVLALGQESGDSFDDLNTALFDLISAGVPAEEALDTLRVTTELAAAGATDTSTAVKALTSSMTAFGDKAGTAQEISEKFFTAQKFGATTVGDLAKEFNKIAGLANNMGVSFDEALASLSALTTDGTKPTAEAATQLKAAFNGIINIQKELGKESQAVQDALSLQNVEQKGLVGALTELKAATGGSVVEMKRLLGSSEALQVALSLTGAQSELVKKQMDEMANAQKRAATFADALAVKQETTQKAMAKFSRTIDAALILLGDQFAPILSKVADLMTGFFQILTKNPTLIKFAAAILGIGTVLAGLVATIAIASTAFLQIRAAMIAANVGANILKFGIRGLAGAAGIGLLIVGISLLVDNWETIWPLMQKTFISFSNIVIPVMQNIVNFLIEGFNSILNGAIKFGKAYLAIWTGIFDVIKGVAGGIGELLVGIFTLNPDKIKSGLKKAKDAIVNGISETFDEIQKIKDEKGTEFLVPVKFDKLDPLEIQKDIDENIKDVKATIKTDTISSSQAAPEKTGDDVLTQAQLAAAEKLRIEKQANAEKVADNKRTLQIINAQNSGASFEEISLLRRKNQLEIDEREALKEKNSEVRSSELSLVKAQQDQLLIDQKDFLARKKEQDAISKEEKMILNEEFDALTKEQQATFDESELEIIQENILTKSELDAMVADEKLNKIIETRNKELIDTQKHGEAFAKINSVLASEEVGLAKQSANQLVGLSRSKNETLKGIGKAAAASQIAIDTAQGAASIFAKLNSLFPILAPGIGIAGAVAITAFGAEKTANVLAANTGGRVPLNAGVAGQDSVQALLTPGELVVPEKNFDEVVASVASSRGNSDATVDSTGDIGSNIKELDLRIELNPVGDLMDFIEQQIIERRIQGIGLI